MQEKRKEEGTGKDFYKKLWACLRKLMQKSCHLHRPMTVVSNPPCARGARNENQKLFPPFKDDTFRTSLRCCLRFPYLTLKQSPPFVHVFLRPRHEQGL